MTTACDAIPTASHAIPTASHDYGKPRDHDHGKAGDKDCGKARAVRLAVGPTASPPARTQVNRGPRGPPVNPTDRMTKCVHLVGRNTVPSRLDPRRDHGIKLEQGAKWVSCRGYWCGSCRGHCCHGPRRGVFPWTCPRALTSMPREVERKYPRHGPW